MVAITKMGDRLIHQGELTVSEKPVPEKPIYTAISFAPVQGFIEKSRKLRDLFEASLILSYLSAKLVESAQALGFDVISSGLVTVKEGMLNRILLKGSTPLDRNTIQSTLIIEWGKILEAYRKWIENRVSED